MAFHIATDALTCACTSKAERGEVRLLRVVAIIGNAQAFPFVAVTVLPDAVYSFVITCSSCSLEEVNRTKLRDSCACLLDITRLISASTTDSVAGQIPSIFAAFTIVYTIASRL